MRLSASRIRAINRSIARNGNVICWGPETPIRRSVDLPKPPSPTLRIVAVPPKKAA